MNADARRRRARAAKKKRARVRKTIEKAEVILACSGHVPFDYTSGRLSHAEAIALLREPSRAALYPEHGVNEKQVDLMRTWFSETSRTPRRQGTTPLFVIDDPMEPEVE